MTRTIDTSTKLPAVLVISILLIGSVSVILALYIGPMMQPDPYGDLPNPAELENDLVPAAFADYVDYERQFLPNAPAYSREADLSNILNLDLFSSNWRIEWNGDIANEIAEKYYAVPGSTVPNFHDFYNMNYWYGIPSFLTTDSVLHAYHTLYDVALRMIENNTLYDQLTLLSKHQVENS